MNKKNLIISFIFSIIAFTGYSQCENSPVLPQFVSPSEGCYVYPDISYHDFSIQEQEFTNGNSNYMVNFYLSQEDANNDVNPIIGSYMLPQGVGAPTFTVFARVHDISTGCVGTMPFDAYGTVGIATYPVTPLEVCDDNDDGFESFDLTSKDNEISGGTSNYIISYHETEEDAINDVNPLASPYTNTQPNTQVVYIRARDIAQNPTCPSYTNFTVKELILEAKNCLSVNSTKYTGFIMYPNPVSNELTIISSSFNNATLTLRSINGKKVINSQFGFNNNKAKLNISHLPKGVYFATLKSANKTVIKKLMIK